MSQPFFNRLRDYYAKVGEVLRGEASAASVFANTTDIGLSREKIYAEFLRQHAPSKCNVLFGGFLFHENGDESKQVDLIVTTDTCPQFNFHNQRGDGKSFACVEGAIACVSIKSFLDKAQLEDSLLNLASIPPTKSLEKRVLPLLDISNYEDWPFKVIYASDGLGADTILGHLHAFYLTHPNIPESRKPNLIHVAGKYLIFRSQGTEILDGNRKLNKGEFVILGGSPDIQAIVWTIDGIQSRASAAAYILFRYDFIVNKVLT